VPVPPSDETATALEQLYVSSGHEIRPVLEAILCSRELYEGPRMTKPPVVWAAGLLRARELGIDHPWHVYLQLAGQRPYFPPDVSGWDDEAWLDTNTMWGRWYLLYSGISRGVTVPAPEWSTYREETADQAVQRAREFWGSPQLTEGCVSRLAEFAHACVPATATAAQRAHRQNALRYLIALCPDYTTA
jgi:uncharacterized protein (DUF1800 family)